MWDFTKRLGRAAWGLGKGYLTSKKSVAVIVGVLLVAGKSLGMELPEDQVAKIVALIMAYVVGQGIADAGKEKHKLIEDTAAEMLVTDANKRKLAALLNAAPDPD